jgi:hypothetical protein
MVIGLVCVLQEKMALLIYFDADIYALNNK